MSENNLTIPSRQAIRRIQSLLQSIPGRGHSITAINLDGDSLQLAQATRRMGRTTITRLAVERLKNATGQAPADAKSKGAAVAQCLRRWRLRPDRVVMGIPRSSVILRSLSLPQTSSPAEMAAMVHYQISKDLPFRIEDAIVDFKVQRAPRPAVSSHGNGALRENASPAHSGPAAPLHVPVLVAIIKKDVLLPYQELARAAGIQLAALGLLSYANARCVEACSIGSVDQCVALATLHPGEVVVDILLGHELVFSRVAALSAPPEPPSETDSQASAKSGADHPACPLAGAPSSSGGNSPATSGVPPSLDDVAIEVIRSLHCYEGLENHSQVTRLYVAGPPSQIPPLASMLHERLNLPVTALNPVQALDITLPEGRQEVGAIAVFGLAYGMLDTEGLPFNFLNPKRPLPPGTGRHTRMLAITAAISVLLCVLVGLRMHLIRQRTALKTSMQQQLNTASKNLSIYRQTLAQARTVKSWLADEKQWLDHLAYLCALLPPSPDLYVTSLSTGSKGSIHLSVKARHSEVITRLDTRLREGGYEMKPPAITPSGDAYGYPFQATMEITPSDDLEIDLAKLQFTARPQDDGSMDPASSGKPRRGAGRQPSSNNPPRKGGAQ